MVWFGWILALIGAGVSAAREEAEFQKWLQEYEAQSKVSGEENITSEAARGMVEQAFQDLLGRQPDVEAGANYTAKVVEGWDETALRHEIRSTRAYANKIENLGVPRIGQPYENGLGMRFVPVTGARVLFSVWETRVEDYAAFVREENHPPAAGMYSDQGDGWKQQGDTWLKPGFAQTALHPVVGVNAADANAFCEWLTKRERGAGRMGSPQSYRLPTDAEWDAAVGESLYPWGEAWPPRRGAGNYADESANQGRYPSWTIIAGYNDGYDATAPVGSFAANRHGLYDLGGNAWERVEGRENGLRGASFLNQDSDDLASSFGRTHGDASSSIGFRVVCVVGSPH